MARRQDRLALHDSEAQVAVEKECDGQRIFGKHGIDDGRERPPHPHALRARGRARGGSCPLAADNSEAVNAKPLGAPQTTGTEASAPQADRRAAAASAAEANAAATPQKVQSPARAQPNDKQTLALARRRGLVTRHRQALLTSLGYRPGGVDNIYGPRTAAALMDFQRAQNIDVSGKIDGATMEALAREAERRTLRISQGQLLLQRAGYRPGAIDGIYSPATQTALLRFQKANGLATTGVIDSKTAELLLSGNAR